MAKKISKPSAAKKGKAINSAPRPPLLRGLVDRFRRLFVEDLPITEYEGSGKFDSQVEKTKLHQAGLEKICGGRTPQKAKLNTTALLTPDPNGTDCAVAIDGQPVGILKKADAKFLLKKLGEAALGACAVKVPAQIRDGRWKKNGPHEDFTVFLSLPKPAPKPAPKVEFAEEGEVEG